MKKDTRESYITQIPPSIVAGAKILHSNIYVYIYIWKKYNYIYIYDRTAWQASGNITCSTAVASCLCFHTCQKIERMGTVSHTVIHKETRIALPKHHVRHGSI